MSTDLYDYSKLLAEQLRTNGVKEEQVRDVVAQVQEHVLSTGEDPLDAFGQPADYAAQWRGLTVATWLRRLALNVVFATGMGAAFAAAAADGPWGSSVPITVDLLGNWLVFALIVAIMPATLNFWIGRRRATRVGRSTHVPEWFLLLMGVLGAASITIALLAAIFGRDQELQVFSVVRWHLLVVAALGLAAIVLNRGGPDRRLPQRPGTPGLMARMRLFGTQVRRFFTQS